MTKHKPRGNPRRVKVQETINTSQRLYTRSDVIRIVKRDRLRRANRVINPFKRVSTMTHASVYGTLAGAQRIVRLAKRIVKIVVWLIIAIAAIAVCSVFVGDAQTITIDIPHTATNTDCWYISTNESTVFSWYCNDDDFALPILGQIAPLRIDDTTLVATVFYRAAAIEFITVDDVCYMFGYGEPISDYGYAYPNIAHHQIGCDAMYQWIDDRLQH